MRSSMFFSPVLVALLLACASPVWAQESDKDTRAREYFLKGKKAYQQGLFEEAMKNFKMALAVRPSPVLEYNIGRCHDKLGQHKKAIASYKRYLVFRPDAPNRKTVEARITALEALVHKPDPPTAPAAPVAPTAESPEEPGQPGTTLGTPAVTKEPAPLTTTPLPKKPAATKLASASKVPVHEAVLALKGGQKKPLATKSSRSGPAAAPTSRDRSKGKPIYKQWYFWVAVAGAVVITGFIIGMAVDSDDRTVSSSPYHMSAGPPGGRGMTVLTF